MTVVVLLHLVGFAAIVGLPLPWEARLVLIVAYLVGLRQAFEPSNVTAVAAGRPVDGRRTGASAIWFALGFAATVAGLAFLFTTALRMLAPDGSTMWVFLGALAVLQIVVLVTAARRRRSTEPARFDRLLTQIRRPVQLFPIGALSALTLITVAEVGLLVLAAGRLTVTGPLYLTVVLPILFAAGTSIISVRTTPTRTTALHIASTGFVALAAAAPTLMSLNLPMLPSLPDTVTGDATALIDDAQSRPAALAGYLLARPGLLLFLLVATLAILALRRAAKKRNTPAPTAPSGDAAQYRPAAPAPAPSRQAQPSGPRKPGLLDRARQALRARRAAPATPAARPMQPARPAMQPAPPAMRPAPPAVQPVSPISPVTPGVQPGPPAAYAAQSDAYPVQPAAYYGRRAVARATVTDAAYRNQPVSGAPGYLNYAPGTGIAIVTGAGAGLGRSTALALANAGYGILAVDIDADNAAACANEARTHGVAAQAVRADLSDPRYLDRIVVVAEQWGRTEILVTAGAGGWPAPNPGETAEMRLSSLAREAMRARGGGVILNTVPATSADAPALTRFTAEQAGARDGVRAMLLITDELAPAAATATALDLIRTGIAGAVVDLTAPTARPQQPRFARGVASVT